VGDKVWSVQIPVLVISAYMFPTCPDATVEEDEPGVDGDHAVLEANNVEKVSTIIHSFSNLFPRPHPWFVCFQSTQTLTPCWFRMDWTADTAKMNWSD
jgi:hypothetical protein